MLAAAYSASEGERRSDAVGCEHCVSVTGRHSCLLFIHASKSELRRVVMYCKYVLVKDVKFPWQILLAVRLGESIVGIHAVVRGLCLYVFFLGSGRINHMYVAVLQVLQCALDASGGPVIGILSDRAMARWCQRRPWPLLRRFSSAAWRAAEGSSTFAVRSPYLQLSSPRVLPAAPMAPGMIPTASRAALPAGGTTIKAS